MNRTLDQHCNFDFNLIKIFNAVVESGNASRASDRLSLTPAAISQALNRLQNTYSFKLFERTQMGLTPTKKGLELYKSYSHVLHIIHDTYSLSNDINESHVITLLGSDIVENYYLSCFIKNSELTKKYTINHYAVNKNNKANLASMLSSGTGDILINLSPPQRSDIEVHLIDVFRDYVCVCGVSSPLSALDELLPHHYYSFPHAAYQSDIFSQELMDEFSLYKNNTEFKLVRKVGYRSDSMLGLMNIVENTNMICIIPITLASFFKNTMGYSIKILTLPDDFIFKMLPVYASLYKKNKYYDILREWIMRLQSIYSPIK